MKELKKELRMLTIFGFFTVGSLILFFTSSDVVREITRWTSFVSSAFFAATLHAILPPVSIEK